MAAQETLTLSEVVRVHPGQPFLKEAVFSIQCSVFSRKTLLSSDFCLLTSG
jgi:hypothetical protein